MEINNDLIPVIEVKQVFKSFKNVHAVKGIDLKIGKGEFVALLGPNGAGKTTLVEMIEGIQKPDKGEILILGEQWKGNEDKLHQNIGLSLQETHFIDKLTVIETLKLFASFYNLKNERIEEVLELVTLQEKRKAYVVNLSGGQRQRLALGISLLNNPKVLILDEPTTGLDPNARREIWSILMDLKNKSQTSLLLTTHYMEEAEQLCDYIVIMYNGEVLKEGTQNQLLHIDDKEKIIEFTLEGIHQTLETSCCALPLNWDTTNQIGTLTISKIDEELPMFFKYLKNNNLQVLKFESRRKTLDDLFTNLTGKHLHE